MITNILYHIKENNKIIQGIFMSDSGELFMHYFKGYFNSQIEEYLLVFYDESATGISKDFLTNHISGSFIEMIKWWVEGNMQQTPEELTTYYRSVISPAITRKNSVS